MHDSFFTERFLVFKMPVSPESIKDKPAKKETKVSATAVHKFKKRNVDMLAMRGNPSPMKEAQLTAVNQIHDVMGSRKQLQAFNLAIVEMINKIKKFRNRSNHLRQKIDQREFNTVNQKIILALKDLSSIELKIKKLNDKLDELKDDELEKTKQKLVEEKIKLKKEILKLSNKRDNPDAQKNIVVINQKIKKLNFKIIELTQKNASFSKEIENLENSIEKLQESIRNAPGFMINNEMNLDSAQIMSVFQLLNGKLKLGTLLSLNSTKLADGIMQIKRTGYEIEAFTGADYKYEVKDYGQLFSVRAGISNKGLRVIKIDSNIIPKGFNNPHLTLEFLYGYSPNYEAEPGLFIRNVKMYNLNAILKLPNLFGKGKVSMLRAGVSQTEIKNGPKERNINLGFSVPLGNNIDLDLYGSVSERKESARSKPDKLGFNVGGVLTVRFH